MEHNDLGKAVVVKKGKVNITATITSASVIWAISISDCHLKDTDTDMNRDRNSDTDTGIRGYTMLWQGSIASFPIAVALI